MLFLIDGYNLLNASRIRSRSHGRTELERARLGLLDFLATILSDDERAKTTVVFDAADAPPGLPHSSEHADMAIRFTRNNTIADDLIEEFIARCSTPRSLVVVSSDHRIHRAARRRKARAIDSDRWLRDRIAKRNRAQRTCALSSEKPSAVPNSAEVAYWTKKFTTKL